MDSKPKQSEIRTSLPYCLYKVDGRFFHLHDGHNSKICFSKVETYPNRRAQNAQHWESIRDRWGIDAHSDVLIYTDRNFNDEISAAEIWTLKVVNDFIRRYRFYDRESVHLVPLNREDLFGFSLFGEGGGTVSVGLGGGIKTADPLRGFEVSNSLEVSFKENEIIPFWEELFLNAEQFLYQTDFRHSILESVIALEMVISEFVLKKCKEKQIAEKEAKDYIRKIGLYGNIKVNLKLLINADSMPDDEIFKKCETSINIRNAIVHKGRKEVSEQEAGDALTESRKLVAFLVPFIR